MYRAILVRHIHSSWLIAWMALGSIIGVIISAHIGAGALGNVVWLILGIIVATSCFAIRQIWVVPVIVLAGLLIGAWRGSLSQHELTVYSHLVGTTTVITGRVAEDPDVGKDGLPTVRLEDIEIAKRHLPGKIWVSLGRKNPAERSDRVTVRGKLGEGFANYSASIYRAQIVAIKRPVPGDVALHLRDSFADYVRKAIHGPAASLGLGYIVGQRRALPPELDTALRIAALMHVVVASGYNLTILVRLARRLFVKISKFLAMCSASTLIIGFIAVTGISPSMSRAGLVAFMSLAAWYYGRQFHPLVLLPLAAAITLLVNPSYGWNDLGWSLSFAAFGGVMILAPLMQRYFFGETKPGTIRQICGETIAAQLATLPLIVAAFGVFSVVGLAANVLILPLVPLAMLLTFGAGLGVWLVPSSAGLIGFPAQVLLNYMIAVAQYVAKLPWAQITIQLSALGIAVYYVVLIAACIWMWRATKLSMRDQNIVV